MKRIMIYFGAIKNNSAYPCGVGNHGHTPDRFIRNVRINDHTFEGCTFAGIRPCKFENT